MSHKAPHSLSVDQGDVGTGAPFAIDADVGTGNPFAISAGDDVAEFTSPEPLCDKEYEVAGLPRSVENI